MMVRLSVRISDDLAIRLKREAQATGETRSQVARKALERHLQVAPDERRFMEAMVEAARWIPSDSEARRETLDLCEEFLPLENEALELAEGRKQGAEETWWD